MGPWQAVGGGGGGQTFVYQKWPDRIFPIVNFAFSHDGHFGLGGGGGRGFWGRPQPPWCLIILKAPWALGTRGGYKSLIVMWGLDTARHANASPPQPTLQPLPGTSRCCTSSPNRRRLISHRRPTAWRRSPGPQSPGPQRLAGPAGSLPEHPQCDRTGHGLGANPGPVSTWHFEARACPHATSRSTWARVARGGGGSRVRRAPHISLPRFLMSPQSPPKSGPLEASALRRHHPTRWCQALRWRQGGGCSGGTAPASWASGLLPGPTPPSPGHNDR